MTADPRRVTTRLRPGDGRGPAGARARCTGPRDPRRYVGPMARPPARPQTPPGPGDGPPPGGPRVRTPWQLDAFGGWLGARSGATGRAYRSDLAAFCGWAQRA